MFCLSRFSLLSPLRALLPRHSCFVQTGLFKQLVHHTPLFPTLEYNNRDMPSPLIAQSFSGNTLIRGVGAASLDNILESSDSRFLLVAERRVCVSGGQQSPAVRWFDLQGLQQLNFTRDLPDQFSVQTGEAGEAAPAPIYLLGQDASGAFKLAADVSKVPQPALAQLQLAFRELRSLMPTLDRGQLAIAGHAVALSQWHQSHTFCARCGAPTAPVEGGARRQCTANQGHRTYPRTDPVCIMLVESPDGQKALLGRSKKVRLPLYTCLAGFIDQGESVEEAVAREVREESGAEVTQVDILGTQPWPIGRGGSCELMIGCLAQARGEELKVNYDEMEDVRWVERSDVLAALAAADLPANPYAGGSGMVGEGESQPPMWIPPSIAIAHHLIRAWAEHDGSWFVQRGGGRGGGGMTSNL